MIVRALCPAAALLVVVMLVAACSSPTVTPPTISPSASPAVSPTAAGSAPSTPSPTPAAATATATASAATSCAERVLASMTVAQRIGQLFLLGLADDRLGAAELKAIQGKHVGSVWFTATTSSGVAGVRQVADAVQAQATEAATARVGFFVAANQEGGLIQALKGPGFAPIPSAVDQGKLSVQVLEADAMAWGSALKKAGVNLDFAPVFDVVPPGGDATNQPIGVLKREYGHDPGTVGTHAAAFVQGMARAGVATTAKHFPGLGRVTGHTDFSAGVVDDITTATDPYLDSFRMGVGAGVPFVMVGLATFTQIDPDHLAAFSPLVMGDLLRGDLLFEGVVMSDDLGATEAVKAIPAGQRAVDFLLAGGDFIVSKTAESTVAMTAAVASLAATDPNFATRVDDAAFRILQAKEAAGLLPCSA